MGANRIVLALARAALVVVAWLTVATASAQVAGIEDAARQGPAAQLTDVMAPPRLALRSWEQAKQLMLGHEPQWQTQRAALARANAGLQRALAQLLPQIEASLGTDYSPVRVAFASVQQAAVHQFFAESSLIPRGSAALSLTFSLSRLATHEAAEHALDAQTHALAGTRQRLLATLGASVLAVLSAERVVARQQAGCDAAADRLQMTRRLVELGRGTELDVQRFVQDLSDARSQLVGAQEALAEARDSLGVALGLREAVAVASDFDVSTLLTPRGAGCKPLPSLSERSDRRAAQAQLAQARASARAAELAFLPEIRVQSQYLASYAPTSAVTFSGRRGLLHNWSVSANLRWTVYDGGTRAAALGDARAAARSAAAQQQATAIATTRESRAAKRLVSVATANVEISRQGTEAARTVDRLARRAMELGHASALEVLDAARRLRQSETTLAVREVELAAARLRALMAGASCR